MATLDGSENESIGNIVGFDLDAGTVVLKMVDSRDLVRRAFSDGAGMVTLVTFATDWRTRAKKAEKECEVLERKLKDAQEDASLAVKELAWVRENGQ